ncbi:MAG: methionine aminotransferase [Salinivirgaceae bacterium]|nr:MAG: methionine aminotransferase [Salinivirgaceae bacterium]
MKFNHSVRGKIADYGTMIFSEVSQLFNEYRAIDLSRGFPNFKQNDVLTGFLKKHVEEERNNYISINGHANLRRHISEIIGRRYGTTYDPKHEVTITAGASQAIYTVLSTLIRENDEVLIFEPSYDLFAPTIEINQGKPIYIKLEQPTFTIDWEKVQKLITPKTRMIILNNPHNPTGSILKAHDFDELQRIVNGTDIMILSDESLQSLVYDGYEHHSVAKYKALAERSFIVGSFGKIFQITGWRVGYCMAPEDLMHEFRKLHQYIAFNVNTPAQFALADYLGTGIDIDAITNEFAQRRDYFAGLLQNTPFTPLKVKSGIFQPVTYENKDNLSDKDVALKLIRECGVAGVPLSAYSHSKTNFGIIRFCFARPQSVIDEAAQKLAAFQID